MQGLAFLLKLKVAFIFISIIENNVQETLTKLKFQRGWILQQDKDLKHYSKSVEAFMQVRSMCNTEGPSLSPALNIRENLWCDLKCVVHARKPTILTELEMFCVRKTVKNTLSQNPDSNWKLSKALGGFNFCIQ